MPYVASLCRCVSKSLLLFMGHNLNCLLSADSFATCKKFLRVDQTDWFVHPSIPCAKTPLMLVKAKLHILRMSSVKASILTENHVNIVAHLIPKVICDGSDRNVFYGFSWREIVMVIRYYPAHDVKQLVDAIVKGLELSYINPTYVYCFRSKGSKSRRIVARIHSLEKLWQLALKTQARYLIEVISERYDKLTHVAKEKVIIHELLHIPKGFSGGFRPHRIYINRKKIDKLHKVYRQHQIFSTCPSET